MDMHDILSASCHFAHVVPATSSRGALGEDCTFKTRWRVHQFGGPRSAFPVDMVEGNDAKRSRFVESVSVAGLVNEDIKIEENLLYRKVRA